jgi:hypothetical protein
VVAIVAAAVATTLRRLPAVTVKQPQSIDARSTRPTRRCDGMPGGRAPPLCAARRVVVAEENTTGLGTHGHRWAERGVGAAAERLAGHVKCRRK